MSKKRNSLQSFVLKCVGVLAVALLATTEPAAGDLPLGTAFTYQGDLQQGGVAVDEPVNGCVFEFSLWNDPASVDPLDQVGPTLMQTELVVGGRFTVALDFGDNIFTGDARWLEIAVCCPSPCGDFTTLSPRQELTPAPHALALPGLYTQQNLTSPNLIGGFSGNNVDPGAVGATIAGGGTAGFENRVFDNYATVSGGLDNKAGNDDGNPASETYATVGGGQSNTASGEWATVGGGESNTASANWATVGGGEENTASGSASTVGGGIENTASGFRSTIPGGDRNTANGSRSTIGGGLLNTASGSRSTVPGGQSNVAAGDFSFAAGQRAKANHAGAFVWGDSTLGDFASTAVDQFLIRAAGGVGIGTTTPATELDVAGTVTATAFVGDGSGLTGINVDDADADPVNELQDLTGVLGQGNDAGGADMLNLGTATATFFVGDGSGLTNLPVMEGVWSENGVDIFYDAGNVGIGTTTPAEKLDVSGNIKASGTIQAGSSITIDGTTNIISSDADLELHVNDGRALRLETNATSPNLIGGFSGNSVEPGAVGATIAGGGTAGLENRVFDNYATVSGGWNNQAGSDDANPASARFTTVGGGLSNTASGVKSTVGGGSFNTASGSASTVGGGADNTASGSRSTVGGGLFNTASGSRSTVPGGLFNVAAGDFSFAAGRSAKASHAGAFVWGDSTEADVASTAVDQFLIRAAGGVGIGTTTPATELDVAGTVTATAFVGDGSGLTGINIDDADADPANELQDLTGVLGQGNDAGGADMLSLGTVNAVAFSGDGSGLTGINVDDADADPANEIQTLVEVLAQGNDAGGADMLNLGNVGIGTTTPAQKLSLFNGELVLQVANNVNDQSILFQNSGGAYTWRLYRSDATENAADFHIAGGPAFADFAALPDRLTIDTAGNVGIGTTTPSAVLDVVGTTELNGDVTINSNLTVDTDTLFVNGTNNRVGIGTTIPNEQLEITGNFRIPASTTTAGVIYSAADRFIHNFGTENLFAGVNAGNLSTSGGGRNTGIGWSALLSITAGQSNTAIGRDALRGNTNGSANTAIGADALRNISSGNFNIAIGFEAGKATTGDNNILIGNDGVAGENNTIRLGNASHTATELNGDVTINSNLTVDTDALFVDGTNDRVGIGTTTPAEALHVSGGNVLADRGTATLNLSRSLVLGGARGEGTYAMIQFQNFDNGGAGLDYIGAEIRSHNSAATDNSGDLRFFVNDGSGGGPSERMRIDRNGDVSLIGNVSIADGVIISSQRFQVSASVTGPNNLQSRYVARIKNTNTDATVEQGVLALQFDADLNGNPGKGNWIQFFEGGGDLAGKIENNNNGNVQYESGGSDYAEMLERLDAEEAIGAGDVVGVFGGKISKRTDGAEWVMAITGNAVVVGNAIYDGTEDLHEIVSFVGQVPVRVRGAVAIGDYIVASGLNDGTAIAVSPQDIAPKLGRLIVGRAWEASDEQGVKLINTVVGLPESASTTAALARTVRSQQAQIDELRLEKDAELGALRAEVEQLRSQIAHFASLEQRFEAIEASTTAIASAPRTHKDQGGAR